MALPEIDWDFKHHDREACRERWGSTCWHCDPDNHRKPDQEFEFTFMSSAADNRALLDLLMGHR